MTGTSCVVTGATGWIGRHALDVLTTDPKPSGSVHAFASTAGAVQTTAGVDLPVAPLDELERLDGQPWLLFHAAFLTRDRSADLGHGRYVAENRAVSERVLSAVDRLRPQAVVYLSSGAVYGDDRDEPYAKLKRQDEADFALAAGAVGAQFLCPRVFNVSGAYMRRPSRYALGDLILQAQAGGPLVVKARGDVERSYVAADDLVRVLIAQAALAEPDVSVFDVASAEVVEMSELAERVRDVCEPADRRILRERDPAAPADRYVGDPAEFARLAGRHGLQMQPLDEQIRRTAAWLQESAHAG